MAARLLRKITTLKIRRQNNLNADLLYQESTTIPMVIIDRTSYDTITDGELPP